MASSTASAAAASAGVTTLGNHTCSLNDKDLGILLEWIDSVPVSTSKKNLGRELSDGVLVAKIIGYYAPKIIEVHNYSPANAADKKKANWETMNRKVFPKLNLKMTDSFIKQITEFKAGVIEMVLWDVRRKIIELFPSSVPKIASPPQQSQGTTSSLAPSRSTRTRCMSTSSATSSSRVQSPAISPSKSATEKASRYLPQKKLSPILEADDQAEDSSTKISAFSTTVLAEGSTAGIEDESQADSYIESILSAGDSTGAFDGHQSSIGEINGAIIYNGITMVPMSLYENLQKEYQRLKKIGKDLKAKCKIANSVADAKEKRVRELMTICQKTKKELTHLKDNVFGTPIIPRKATPVPSYDDLTGVLQAATAKSGGSGWLGLF